MKRNLGGNELQNWSNVERKKEGSTFTYFPKLKQNTKTNKQQKTKSLEGFSLDPLGHHVLENEEGMGVVKGRSAPPSPQGVHPEESRTVRSESAALLHSIVYGAALQFAKEHSLPSCDQVIH